MNVISRKISDESPDAIANRMITKAEYRDGLQEIAIGILILAFTVLMLTPAVFEFFTYKAFFWGGLLLIPIAFGSQWIIKEVRKRYLMEKTGYVKLNPVNRKRLGIRLGIVLGGSCAIAAVVAYVTIRALLATHRGGGVAYWGLLQPLSWLILGNGILFGAIGVFRIRVARYVVGGVLMAVMGILLAFSGVSLNSGLAVLYGFAGLFALISGCVVFVLFIRERDEASE